MSPAGAVLLVGLLAEEAAHGDWTVASAPIDVARHLAEELRSGAAHLPAEIANRLRAAALQGAVSVDQA